ncbi:hypothetical protein GALL_213410 [mine drainage metagenome]|uniref:Uncharacterized protein n=1 Tax=mine drainage metagenome TaxID=410659 RepID=A0A1J5RKS7_9ZZZZ
MKQQRTFLAGLIAAAIGAFLCSAPAPARPASPAAVSAGTVAVSPAQAAASGIEVRALPLTRFQPRTSAYASVLDPGPLFQWRGRLRSALAQVAAAHARASAAAREYRRLALLDSQDQTVSDQAAEAARAAWETDRAHLEAARATLSAARDEARSRWGEVLAGWALAPHAPQLAALASGRQALLSVAVPQAGATGRPPATIRIGRGEIAAHLISASPLADPVSQCPTYFYRAARGGLRTGMRVDALLPEGPALEGVVIPNAAVVWYADRPWAYVQSDDAHFARREIAVTTPAPGGWFVAQWHGGERVAVGGAALLLSQELQPKPQAGSPGGDDDDDD